MVMRAREAPASRWGEMAGWAGKWGEIVCLIYYLLAAGWYLISWYISDIWYLIVYE
jgi:hypothetical protein